MEEQDNQMQEQKFSNFELEMFRLMGHDVRNAMTSVQLLTQLALRNKEIESAPHLGSFLSKIDIQSNKLCTLVNQFLDLAKIQSGTLDISRKNTNIKLLLEAIFTKSALQFKNLQLNEVEEAEVFLDPLRMEQVISSLLAAVRQSLPEDSSIAIEARSHNKSLLIGISFPHGATETSAFSSLMTPGQEPSNPTVFIAYRIIQQHEGRMWLENDGTATISTLFIDLPR